MSNLNTTKTSKKLGFVKAVTNAINHSTKFIDSGIRPCIDDYEGYMSNKLSVYAAYDNSLTSVMKSVNHDEHFTEYFVSSPKVPAKKLLF